MLFCEVYLPRGTHTPEKLGELTDRLTLAHLLEEYIATGGDDSDEAASSDAGVMIMLANLNHVVVHEIEYWTAGGRRVEGADPRYLARFYLPAPWRKEMSAFLIPAATSAIRGLHAGSDPGRGPRIEVQVLGVPEGSYGLDGRIVGEPELMDMISAAKTGPDAPPDPGALVDPVCGMIATNTELTLVHEGITYGFCSAGCRKHFARTLADKATR